MTKLPKTLTSLSQHPKLLKKLKKGVAVQVVAWAEDFDAQDRDNYYRLLGFPATHQSDKFCTILSEIANMPGHYVVVGHQGTIVCGLHSDIFYIHNDE